MYTWKHQANWTVPDSVKLKQYNVAAVIMLNKHCNVLISKGLLSKSQF